MKFILSLFFLFLIVSCAHHHSSSKHHHHAYDKRCAYSVSKGEFEKHGSEEINLEHGGRTYYFSSEEKKKAFVQSLDENIFKANRNWEERLGEH